MNMMFNMNVALVVVSSVLTMGVFAYIRLLRSNNELHESALGWKTFYEDLSSGFQQSDEMTISEAAERYGMSKSTLRGKISENKLPSRKVYSASHMIHVIQERHLDSDG